MGRADGRYQIKVPNHGTKQRYQITVAKQALNTSVLASYSGGSLKSGWADILLAYYAIPY